MESELNDSSVAPPPALIEEEQWDASLPLGQTSYTTLLSMAPWLKHEPSFQSATDNYISCKSTASAPYKCEAESRRLLDALKKATHRLKESKCESDFLKFRWCLDQNDHSLVKCQETLSKFQDCVKGSK